MVTLEINKVLSIVPDLIGIPYKNIWYSYDEEADVLYLNFKNPVTQMTAK